MDIDSESVQEGLIYLSVVTTSIKAARKYIIEASSSLDKRISNPYGQIKEDLRKRELNESDIVDLCGDFIEEANKTINQITEASDVSPTGAILPNLESLDTTSQNMEVTDPIIGEENSQANEKYRQSLLTFGFNETDTNRIMSGESTAEQVYSEILEEYFNGDDSRMRPIIEASIISQGYYYSREDTIALRDEKQAQLEYIESEEFDSLLSALEGDIELYSSIANGCRASANNGDTVYVYVNEAGVEVPIDVSKADYFDGLATSCREQLESFRQLKNNLDTLRQEITDLDAKIADPTQKEFTYLTLGAVDARLDEITSSLGEIPELSLRMEDGMYVIPTVAPANLDTANAFNLIKGKFNNFKIDPYDYEYEYREYLLQTPISGIGYAAGVNITATDEFRSTIELTTSYDVDYTIECFVHNGKYYEAVSSWATGVALFEYPTNETRTFILEYPDGYTETFTCIAGSYAEEVYFKTYLTSKGVTNINGVGANTYTTADGYQINVRCATSDGQVAQERVFHSEYYPHIFAETEFASFGDGSTLEIATYNADEVEMAKKYNALKSEKAELETTREEIDQQVRQYLGIGKYIFHPDFNEKCQPIQRDKLTINNAKVIWGFEGPLYGNLFTVLSDVLGHPVTWPEDAYEEDNDNEAILGYMLYDELMLGTDGPLYDTYVSGLHADNFHDTGVDINCITFHQKDVYVGCATKWKDVMTQQERDIFFYICNTEGYEAGFQYIDSISRELDQRYTNKEHINEAKWATKDTLTSIWASVRSVFLKPIEGLRALDYSLNARRNDSNIFRTNIISRADWDRGAIAESIADTSNALSFIYSLGMSMADSGVVVGLTAASGGSFGVMYTTLILGSSVYVTTLNSALDRGFNDDEAIGMAFLFAVTEIAMESYSLSHLFKADMNYGEFLKRFPSLAGKVNALSPNAQKVFGGLYIFLTQALVEMDEEVCTTILDRGIDWAMEGVSETGKSQFTEDYERYMKLHPNCSEDDAYRFALGQFFSELKTDALGGLISGGAFGSLGAGKFVYNYGRGSNVTTNSDTSIDTNTTPDIDTLPDHTPIDTTDDSTLTTDDATQDVEVEEQESIGEEVVPVEQMISDLETEYADEGLVFQVDGNNCTIQVGEDSIVVAVSELNSEATKQKIDMLTNKVYIATRNMNKDHIDHVEIVDGKYHITTKYGDTIVSTFEEMTTYKTVDALSALTDMDYTMLKSMYESNFTQVTYDLNLKEYIVFTTTGEVVFFDSTELWNGRAENKIISALDQNVIDFKTRNQGKYISMTYDGADYTIVANQFGDTITVSNLFTENAQTKLDMLTDSLYLDVRAKYQGKFLSFKVTDNGTYEFSFKGKSRHTYSLEVNSSELTNQTISDTLDMMLSDEFDLFYNAQVFMGNRALDIKVENGQYVITRLDGSTINVDRGGLSDVNLLNQLFVDSVIEKCSSGISSWHQDGDNYVIKTIYGDTITVTIEQMRNIDINDMMITMTTSKEYASLRRFLDGVVQSTNINSDGTLTITTKYGDTIEVPEYFLKSDNFFYDMVIYRYQHEATLMEDGRYRIVDKYGNEYILTESEFANENVLLNIYDSMIEYEALLVNEWLINNIQDMTSRITPEQQIAMDAQVDAIATRIGATREEVYAAINSSLRRIVSESSFANRISINTLNSILSSWIKNQHETGDSGGAKNPQARRRLERELFSVPETVDPRDAANYGLLLPDLDTAADYARAVDYYRNGPGHWYGRPDNTLASGSTECVIIYDKSKIMANTTVTIGDSLDYAYYKSGSGDGIFVGSPAANPEFTGAFDGFLDNVKSLDDIENATLETFSPKHGLNGDHYIEIQVHGRYAHSIDVIQEIVFLVQPDPALTRMLDSMNIPWRVI